MNKFQFLFLGLCLAVLLLPSTVRLEAQDLSSRATSPISADVARLAPAVPQAVSVYKLKTTMFSYGLGTAIGSGFVALDSPVLINCKKTTNCLYEASQHIQASTGVANNRVALCTQIDGVYMNPPNCAYLGLIDPDGFFHAVSFVAYANVPPGHHFLQTFIYTDAGVTLGWWDVSYHLYILVL